MKICRHFQLIKFKNDLLRVIIRAELQHSADIELFRISHYVEIRKGKKKKPYTSKRRGLLKHSFPPPPPLGLLQSHLEEKATHHTSMKMKHILLQEKIHG